MSSAPVGIAAPDAVAQTSPVSARKQIGELNMQLVERAMSGEAPARPSRVMSDITFAGVDSEGTALSQFITDVNRFGTRVLSPDCQPTSNCQPEGGTTANNMTAFRTAEDFVPATNGSINEVCFQGIFFDLATEATCIAQTNNFIVNVFPIGANGAPDEANVLDSFTTGVDATVTQVVTTDPLFAGRQIIRWEISLSRSVPVTAFECYALEIKHIADGCSIFWEQSPQGNGRFFQTPEANQFQPGSEGTGDFAVCFGVAIDIFAADDCLVFCGFPPINDECTDAENDPSFALSVPDSVVADTLCATISQGPAAPEFADEVLPTTQPGVWYTLTATNNDPIELTLSSSSAEPAFVVYCGGCEFLWPVTGAGQPDNATQGFTTASTVFTPNVGTEYLILVTSDLNRADDLTLDVVNVAAPGPDPVVCGPCDLINSDLFDSANIIEENQEPCDDTGNGRVNGGCFQDGGPVHIQVQDGDVVAGNIWSTSEQRDSDWFEIDVPSAPAVVQFFVESQRDMIVERIGPSIDNGIELDAAGCGQDLFIRDRNIARSCSPSSLSFVATVPGKYYYRVLPQIFGGQPCGTANDYVAVISVSDCEITPPGSAISDGEACGDNTVNPGCTGVAAGGTPGPSSPIAVGQTGFGSLYTFGTGSRDLDSWRFTATATDLDISVESEVPFIVILSDLSAGCFGPGLTFTGGACGQTTISIEGFDIGTEYEILITSAELDGEGIFGEQSGAGFTCANGFNTYLLSIAEPGAGGDACLGGIGSSWNQCTEQDAGDCSANGGVPQGAGTSCPVANPCQADQTGPAFDGIADGAVTTADLNFFLSEWTNLTPRADITGPAFDGIPDNVVTVADLNFFLAAFLSVQPGGSGTCAP
ncbi:MAG: hypothetical protein EA378_08770 [Phycisphaerales bacterium]|nr:MAG: hypothetical protein EA378_08770 [Phycisphaerales bacterium]